MTDRFKKIDYNTNFEKDNCFECSYRGSLEEVATKIYSSILENDYLAEHFIKYFCGKSLLLSLEEKNKRIQELTDTLPLKEKVEPSVAEESINMNDQFVLESSYICNRNMGISIPISNQNEWHESRIEAHLMYKDEGSSIFVEDGFAFYGSIVESSKTLIEFKHLKINKMKPINRFLKSISPGIKKKNSFRLLLKNTTTGATKISTPFQIISKSKALKRRKLQSA